MKRFIPCIIFSLLMAFSPLLFAGLGPIWENVPFVFFLVGFVVSFILAHLEFKKIRKYWDRCHEMSHDFNVQMLRHLIEGDFQSAESFKNRGAKVLELWERSLKTNSIPEEPNLDDI